MGGVSIDQQAETLSIQNIVEHIGQISSEVQMETLFEAAELDLEEVEQFVPEQFTPPLAYELPVVPDEILSVSVSPSKQSDMELVQERIHDAFGCESEIIDVHFGTGTEFLEIHDDSEETVVGRTDKDDDNADHDDNPSPLQEHPVVGASNILCDPPMTQEEIRLDEGDLVENENVSLSEGVATKYGESETGDKNQDETLP